MNLRKNRPRNLGRLLHSACVTALSAVILPLCLGCNFNPFYNPLELEGFHEIENPVTREDLKPSDFMGTVLELYPKCNNIVLATLTQDDFPEATFVIDKTIIGNLTKGTNFASFYEAENDEQRPQVNKQYLLFLNVSTNEEGSKEYELLFDDAGWLMINGDIIAPSYSGFYDLKTAFNNIAFMEQRTVLPHQFYYDRTLEQLVNASDYVFVASIAKIGEPVIRDFFSRGQSVEKTSRSYCQYVDVKIDKMLKGKADTIGQIITGEFMLKSTLETATNEAVKYNNSDAPELIENQQYLFFCIQPPSGVQEGYSLPINNIQGAVPIFDGTTFPIQTNAAFTRQFDIEDLILEIEEYVRGDSPSVQYPIGANVIEDD